MFMKTAEQILADCIIGNGDLQTYKEVCLIAMKKYSNQKLEKASELAFQAINDSNNSASEIEQEILKLKD